MPTAHTRYSFKFSELSEQTKTDAVSAVAAKLGGEWWDENDREEVAQAIVHAFAVTLGSPKALEYGEGDFPGIDGVTLDGWDIERDSSVALRGTLTRVNAPGLPWADGVGSVRLDGGRGFDGTTVNADEDDIMFDCTSCGQKSMWSAGDLDVQTHVIAVGDNLWADDDAQNDDHDPWLLEGLPNRQARCQAVAEATRDAVSAAVSAGRTQLEWQGSEERAREWIEDNDPDFNEDGSLF